jgi:hypothetical protein
MFSGCFSDPAYEQQRLANLTSAVDELAPENLSDVICDVKGGEVGLKTGFTRTLVLKGADAWQPVLDRFEALGYSVSGVDPRLSATRTDGLMVAGRLIERPGAESELEVSLEERGCGATPAEGAVVIHFEEGPAT